MFLICQITRVKPEIVRESFRGIPAPRGEKPRPINSCIMSYLPHTYHIPNAHIV